jgi:hypothetical protein
MYIFEKLFLLAFTNQKNAVGEYFFSTPYIILITVLDLFIKEYLDINTTNPKQMDIKVLKQSSDNLSHIEKLIFEYVASDSKFNKVDETVKFFTKTRISEQILEKLIQQNILIKEKRKFLFFRYKKNVLSEEGIKLKLETIETITATLQEKNIETNPKTIEIFILILVLHKLNTTLRIFQRYISNLSYKDLSDKINKFKEKLKDEKVEVAFAYTEYFTKNIIPWMLGLFS